MNEVALCRSVMIVIAKQPDSVAHAAGAELLDTQSGVHDVGKSHRCEVIALRLDNKADDVATLDIENALLNQILIDCRIKERVVDDVVDV